MNTSFKKYFEDLPNPKILVEPTILESHIRAMNEEVIPNIISDQRENERIVQRLRFRPL